MKNITIPEPCSENWNEMTPNEKGAFCQKCALDVYDFTNKTADEIREVLTLNIAAPVCMRIEPKQLDELNADFSAWKINNKQSYHRAWVFTFFVVFGLTLFSCEEDEKPVVEKFHQTGQVILSSDEKQVQIADSTNDVNAKSEITQRKVVENGLPEMDFQRIPLHTMGKPIVVQEKKELDEVVVAVDYIREEIYTTAGVPLISYEYTEYLKESSDGFKVKLDTSEPEKITGLVYPNPASNETTLKINMPNRGKGEIELITLSGQKIRSIHSGRIKKGESEYQIYLTDLETGVYLVVVYSGELKETIRFAKI